MSSVGPGSNTPYKITRALSHALREHTKYVSNLPLWKQFIVWRYTLGSGAVNASLIGIATDDQQIYWVYNFFSSFNYHQRNIPKSYSRYLSYFSNPKSFLESNNKLLVARKVIDLYIKELQSIIYRSPVIKHSFPVWKVSSSYPGLPESQSPDDILVEQTPFNSTSYNPQFNFGFFISPDATCCLHNITVTKGSHVLLVPTEYHAYPFELECILPHSSKFIVKTVTQEGFYYIPKENQKLISLQDNNNLHIGPVYMVDPTSNNNPVHKQLKYYISSLRT